MNASSDVTLNVAPLAVITDPEHLAGYVAFTPVPCSILNGASSALLWLSVYSLFAPFSVPYRLHALLSSVMFATNTPLAVPLVIVIAPFGANNTFCQLLPLKSSIASSVPASVFILLSEENSPIFVCVYVLSTLNSSPTFKPLSFVKCPFSAVAVIVPLTNSSALSSAVA